MSVAGRSAPPATSTAPGTSRWQRDTDRVRPKVRVQRRGGRRLVDGGRRRVPGERQRLGDPALPTAVEEADRACSSEASTRTVIATSFMKSSALLPWLASTLLTWKGWVGSAGRGVEHGLNDDERRDREHQEGEAVTQPVGWQSGR